jgi:hypothetical protein
MLQQDANVEEFVALAGGVIFGERHRAQWHFITSSADERLASNLDVSGSFIEAR